MLNYSPNVEKGYVSIKPVPGKLGAPCQAQ